jgi:uncharacterized delta-60 repeat protein
MKRTLLLHVIFVFCLKANAQSGVPDPSFGSKGILKTDFGFIYDYQYSTSGKQVLLQPDGSMYILLEAGAASNRQSYIAKRLSNGAPDVTYGNNGFSVPIHIVAAAAAKQSDGKIVVAGEHGQVNSVARLNTDGTPDNSFSGDGIETIEFIPAAIAVQTDGKIIAAGSMSNGSDEDFIVARYNSDGSPDNTFAGDGSQTTDFGSNDFAVSIAIQGDDKIVVAGRSFQSSADFALARYNSDGSPDNTFSEDGRLTADFSSQEDIAVAVAILSTGKILVAGYTLNGNSNQIALARYNADGAPDNAFDEDGKKISDFSFEYIATSLNIQSDDKILVAGYAFPNGDADFAVARFNADGDPDNVFGENGVETTAFSGADHAFSLAVNNNGEIILAGEDDDGTEFALIWYTTEGELDDTFDEDGKLTDRLHLNQGSTFYTSTVIQSDGKILAGGYTWNGSNYDFAIARYNTNGTPDNSFSEDGRQTTNFGSSDDYAYGLTLQVDGKIVLAGVAGSDFAVARYNADGNLDNSFSGDGKQTTNFGFEDNAASVAVQADGKIILAGWSVNGIDPNSQLPVSDFAVARYNTNGTLDNSFSGDGKQTTSFGFDEMAKSIAIQGDGKIIVAGIKQIFAQGGNTSQFALARYNIDGNLDNSFSSDGKQLTTINENAYANSIAVQPDGKIVVGGNTSFDSETATDFVLARYDKNGSLDNNFGEGNTGIETTYFGSVYKFSNPIVIQGDGKIILAGGNDGNFAIARYTNSGVLDNTFGDNGIQVTEASPAEDRIEGLALGNEKLYAAGYGQYPGNLGVVASYLLAGEGPVPVSLIGFTGTLKANTVYLQWTITNEHNLSSYIIERSNDAHNFSSIGSVSTAGNSGLNKSYSIIDQQPLKGTNFYRLKMLDLDNKFSYSKIVAVKMNESSMALQLFPNPAKDILFVQADGKQEHTIHTTVDIKDAIGRRVKQVKVNFNGSTSFSVDISNLADGVYNLVVHGETETIVKTFVKK